MSKSDEQIERESTAKQRRTETKSLPDFRQGRGGEADWANAKPEVVMGLVCTVATTGGAVRLGYTRDGGAYSIGIYQGDQSKTYYCNDGDGIDGFINELKTYFEK